MGEKEEEERRRRRRWRKSVRAAVSCSIRAVANLHILSPFPAQWTVLVPADGQTGGRTYRQTD